MGFFKKRDVNRNSRAIALAEKGAFVFAFGVFFLEKWLPNLITSIKSLLKHFKVRIMEFLRRECFFSIIHFWQSGGTKI